MKLKEIWTFIKTVLWPAAKPFICASREEAEEVVNAWRKSQRQKNDFGLSPDFIPVFVLRCIDALENEETPRQNRK